MWELEDITLGLVVAIIAISVGFVYFIVNYQYKKKNDIRQEIRSDSQTAKLDKYQVDSLAERVKANQAETAEKLKTETALIAEKTKTEMQAYVDRQTDDLKKDYGHKFEVVDLKIDAIHEAIANVIQKNADTALINAKTADRLEKQMDRIQQFEWGRDAKSVPAYLTGDEETQEHKDKPGEGLFKDPSSG